MTWEYDTDLWTTGWIATVIHRTFTVHLHRAHVGRLLTKLGCSCQKPERRAVKRDDVAPERPSRIPRRMWVCVDSRRRAPSRRPRDFRDGLAL